jgi:hypothetical protein
MEKDKICVTDTRGGVQHHQLRSDGGRQIKWVAPDGTERIPEETKTDYPYPGIFKAAGKVYPGLRTLCKDLDKSGICCTDLYGRQVLYISELFPCFDSYDYMNENRYYRWFFIKEDGKLTRVYYADTRGVVQVTEDVRTLETRCLEEMKKLNWLE